MNLLQGSPAEVSRLASSGTADIALTTRPAEDFPELLFLEYRKLPRVLVMPAAHPLLREKRITLKAISRHPLITLDIGSHGQQQMRELFARSGLAPNIVFAGVDVDVIKAFVEAGLGVAVLPQLAFEPGRDAKLRALDVNHLFEAHAGCLAIRRNHYLRGYAYDFIRTLAPEIDRHAVEKALVASRAPAT